MSISATYTAILQPADDGWIGWIEEVPGVNSQGRTREEVLDNLRDALEEALGTNRSDAVLDSAFTGSSSLIQIVVKEAPGV